MSHQVRFRTGDGAELHAEIRGSGRPMLLCNGLYCSTHYYGPWAEHFSRSHAVVTFDYRGHGKSGPAPDPARVGLEHLTRDALAVLEHLDLRDAIIVGHSMGVRVALEAGVAARDRVSSAVLLCGSVWGLLGDGRLGRGSARLAGAGIRALGAARPLSSAMRTFATHPDVLFTAAGMMGGADASTPREPLRQLCDNVRSLDIGLMASLVDSYIKHSGRESARALRRPILQIVGARDQLAPPFHARDVERTIPDVRTHVMQGCTHLAPIERPVELHAVVERFITR